MSEKAMLIEVVSKARESLAVAKRNVDATPKPQNACSAHDGHFAMNQANAGALDTLLMIKQEELKDETKSAAAPSTPLTLWGFVCVNAKAVIWACAMIVCIAIVFGQLDALGNLIARVRSSGAQMSAVQYQPPE